MTNCSAPLVPTLEQLQAFRGRPAKADVIKSASELVPVCNADGLLVGFGELDGIAVSKSADVDDLAILDEFFPFIAAETQEVEKSAELIDDENAILEGAFPLCLQSN